MAAWRFTARTAAVGDSVARRRFRARRPGSRSTPVVGGRGAAAARPTGAVRAAPIPVRTARPVMALGAATGAPPISVWASAARSAVAVRTASCSATVAIWAATGASISVWAATARSAVAAGAGTASATIRAGGACRAAAVLSSPRAQLCGGGQLDLDSIGVQAGSRGSYRRGRRRSCHASRIALGCLLGFLLLGFSVVGVHQRFARLQLLCHFQLIARLNGMSLVARVAREIKRKRGSGDAEQGDSAGSDKEIDAAFFSRRKITVPTAILGKAMSQTRSSCSRLSINSSTWIISKSVKQGSKQKMR